MLYLVPERNLETSPVIRQSSNTSSLNAVSSRTTHRMLTLHWWARQRVSAFAHSGLKHPWTLMIYIRDHSHIQLTPGWPDSTDRAFRLQSHACPWVSEVPRWGSSARSARENSWGRGWAESASGQPMDSAAAEVGWAPDVTTKWEMFTQETFGGLERWFRGQERSGHPWWTVHQRLRLQL